MGKPMTTYFGKTLFSSRPFLPATPLTPSQTLDGLFELTRRPSRAFLNSPRALLWELQRNKDTSRHRGSRTLSRTTDANLASVFVENASVFVEPNIGMDSVPP